MKVKQEINSYHSPLGFVEEWKVTERNSIGNKVRYVKLINGKPVECREHIETFTTILERLIKEGQQKRQLTRKS